MNEDGKRNRKESRPSEADGGEVKGDDAGGKRGGEARQPSGEA